MPLIELNRSEPEKKIVWTKTMLKAKEFLLEEQIRTFADFPYLINDSIKMAIKDEIRDPEPERVIKNIYKAVKNADVKNFLYFHNKFRQWHDDPKITIDENYIRQALKTMLLREDYSYWNVMLIMELEKENSLFAIVITMDELRTKLTNLKE